MVLVLKYLVPRLQSVQRLERYLKHWSKFETWWNCLTLKSTLKKLFCTFLANRMKKSTNLFSLFQLIRHLGLFHFVFSESEIMDETMKKFQESLTELEAEAKHLLIAWHQLIKNESRSFAKTNHSWFNPFSS